MKSDGPETYTPELDALKKFNLSIVDKTHPVLHTPVPFKIQSMPIEDCHALGYAMLDLMYALGGIGLAAPQVGYGVHMFVMDISKDRLNPVVVVNPRIIHFEDAMCPSVEGCLTLSGEQYTVKRYKQIQWAFTDMLGIRHKRTATGLESMCVQHEIDHLDGILISEIGSLVVKKAV